MRILALTGLLTFLASCRAARDPEAIEAFHRDYSAGNFRDACGGEGECERTLRTAFAILGPVKTSQATAEDSQVYKTEYQRGTARERFGANYTIEIEFGDLAVRQWKEFRGHWAAGSLDAACAMTASPAGCLQQLDRVTAALGKPEISIPNGSTEDFAGSVSRSRQKPFPAYVRLETKSRFAHGEARENFEWEIQPEAGFRILSFSIEKSAPANATR